MGEIKFKDVKIDSAAIRKTLVPKPEPYWGRRLRPNQHLGYRKIDSRTGSWVARLKRDGKRQYQALGFETDAFGFDQARAAANAWFDTQNKSLVDDSNLTVRAACAAYVKNMRDVKKRENTAHDAEKRFERVVDESDLGSVLLVNLKKAHVQKWLDGLGMSSGSLHRTFTSLRAALNLAVRQEKVSADVRKAWTELEMPDLTVNRRTRFLNLKQRRALLAAAKGGLHDLIEAALLTGARPGEIVNAACGQFNAHAKTMTFIGKNFRKTGPRTVGLVPQAYVLFKRLTKGKPDHARIFTRDDGMPWNHSDWDELVKAAAKKAGLPDDVVLYTCRHSWISQAISDGLTTLEVATMSGTSLAMIQKHYGHLVPGATQQRLARVKFV